MYVCVESVLVLIYVVATITNLGRSVSKSVKEIVKEGKSMDKSLVGRDQARTSAGCPFTLEVIWTNLL
jgi:hypothetical protein